MHWIWPVVSALTANAVRTRMPARDGCVYLTFDDGPHPQHTPPLLDLLDRHGVKATFFQVGLAAQQWPAVARLVVAAGHQLGNHSMTHPRLPALSASLQLDEIDRADAVLQHFDGQARHPFRPPSGKATVQTIGAAVWRRQPMVLWSIDSLDFRLTPAQVVERMRGVPPRAGDILLFHDDSGCAHAALTELLPSWLGDGLRFLTLNTPAAAD